MAAYHLRAPDEYAAKLQALWQQFEPASMQVIGEEERRRQQTLGIPVAVLKSRGRVVAGSARRQVSAFVPLARVARDAYGREGRVVALVALGAMELADPEKIVPLLREMCASCASWEDADRLALDALEPIVRKDPAQWLPRIEPWLEAHSAWVRRSAVMVMGCLPMKHPDYTVGCLEGPRRLLIDEEPVVRKAVSFAMRLCARGDFAAVRDFLERNVPPGDARATWVLCDVARSMARRLQPEFTTVVPRYEHWLADASLGPTGRRSIESALRALRISQQ